MRIVSRSGGSGLKALFRLSRAAEKQNIAVRVSEFEAAQALVCILEWFAEGRAVIDEFRGKSIGVWRIDIGVPPHRGMTPGIRQRCNVPIGLKEELRSIAADDGEKRIPLRILKRRLKSKLFTIERDRSIDVADDEER